MRTAQFCIGRCVLKQQLAALGISAEGHLGHERSQGREGTPTEWWSGAERSRRQNRMRRLHRTSRAWFARTSPTPTPKTTPKTTPKQTPKPTPGIDLADSLLTSMYNEMGACLALQYAGSQARL